MDEQIKCVEPFFFDCTRINVSFRCPYCRDWLNDQELSSHIRRQHKAAVSLTFFINAAGMHFSLACLFWFSDWFLGQELPVTPKGENTFQCPFSQLATCSFFAGPLKLFIHIQDAHKVIPMVCFLLDCIRSRSRLFHSSTIVMLPGLQVTLEIFWIAEFASSANQWVYHWHHIRSIIWSIQLGFASCSWGKLRVSIRFALVDSFSGSSPIYLDPENKQ